MKSTTRRAILTSLAILALLIGQAEAAPQVTNILTDGFNYESFFSPVSNSDIGDVLQGATTTYTGGGLGTNDAGVIDGLLSVCCTPGDILLPDDGGVLEIFLDTSVNSAGYDITSLVNTTGWNGSSFTNHQYVVAMRPVGGSYADVIDVQFPLPPDDVDNTPPSIFNPGVQLTINDDGGGILGSRIDAVRFTFNNINGGTSPEAYQEFDVYGTALPPIDPATEYAWDLPGSGDWNSQGSWDRVNGPGTIPDSNEHTAVFSESIQGPSTVTAVVPVTVNRIQFDNAANMYSIAGLGGVTFAATGGGGNPSISTTGTHEFRTKVDLQADTVADAADASSLSFNDALNLNGNDLTLTGAGTTNINNVLNAGGGMVNLSAGTLGGGGEVGGNVDNSGGSVSPGNSPGILTIDGDYTQGSGGTLLIEINGTTPGVEYDRLVVTGAANLDGTLEVLLGFTPANDASFDILDFASVNNDFTTFTMNPLFTWDVNDGTLCYNCGTPSSTDYDNDGTWGLGDLNLVLFNWNEDGATLPAAWLNNRPGAGTLVGLPELNQVLFNWGQPGSVVAVPEPASLVVLLIWALLCCGRRTSRSRGAP